MMWGQPSKNLEEKYFSQRADGTTKQKPWSRTAWGRGKQPICVTWARWKGRQGCVGGAGAMSAVVRSLDSALCALGSFWGGFQLKVAWSDLHSTKKMLAPKWCRDLYSIILIIIVILIIGAKVEAGGAVRSFSSNRPRCYGSSMALIHLLCLKPFLEVKGWLTVEPAHAHLCLQVCPALCPADRRGLGARCGENYKALLIKAQEQVFHRFVFLVCCILSVPQLRLNMYLLGWGLPSITGFLGGIPEEAEANKKGLGHAAVESEEKAGKTEWVERREVSRDTSFEQAKDRFGLLFNLAWGWPASTEGDVIPLCGNGWNGLITTGP